MLPSQGLQPLELLQQLSPELQQTQHAAPPVLVEKRMEKDNTSVKHGMVSSRTLSGCLSFVPVFANAWNPQKSLYLVLKQNA